MFSSHSPEWYLKLVIIYSTLASWGLGVSWPWEGKLRPGVGGVGVWLNGCG